MKNKLFKKALSVFTAMAMMLSLMTGIPFSELGLGITVNAESECTCETDDPAFHATNCPAYIAPENPQCTCAEKCTDDTLNVWCDVCGVQGVSACQGEETAVAYANGVASITNGETVTNYATFDETLANWTDGTTLTLLADVTLTERIKTYAKGLSLDLNGHKIECSDTLCTIWIDGASGSELTIRDSQNGGHINGVVYAVGDESKLCLESGTVETVDAQGDFTMTGGQIISEDGSGLYVNGGGDVVISGGEIYGSEYGVRILNGKDVIISGDTKITGADQYAIRSTTSTEVVISGTPTISGGAGEFWLYEQITLNTQPANGEVWRVKINTEEITDGIFAVPGEGIALDASKFASAMDGYDVKQNAKGELLLCNHQTAYAAVSNEDGSTHKMLCCCRKTTVEESVACSGFGATCQTKAVCAACGQSYGETNPDVHTFNDDGKCVCGAERNAATTVDLSSLTATYVISNSGEYIFTGSGSYGIKVESGNPKIVLNNVNISLTDGDYYGNNPINGIHIATTGGTTEILVLGESSITAKAGAGIFVAEGGTVKITGSSREDILIATGASGCSGIGGYVYHTNGSVNCGNIEISNVTVKAFGSDSSMGDRTPAIGGAGNGNCGYITIDNADVYAEGYINPYGYEGSSAIGTGDGWRNREGGTIGEISIINDSKVYVTRGNYCDYIGCCGHENAPADGVVTATAKSSTIYCYDSTGTTEPVQTLKYGALGDLLVEDENGNWVCEGEHSDDITTYQNESSTITAICENCKCEFIVLALITENKIFDGTPVTAVVEKAGSLKNELIEITYCCEDGCIDAGEHTASITYEDVTAECMFTIAPIELTATINGTVSKVYDGTTDVPAAHTLEIMIDDTNIISGDTVSVSDVKYCYETADVGETTIIAEITIDNSNYVLAEKTISAEIGNIEALDISNAEITLGDAVTYNGQNQTQEIASVVVDGITLTADDYSISSNTGTDSNTYTMTITGRGNFTGEVEVEFTIGQLDISNAEITLGDAVTYNGQNQTQEIASVVVDGITLTADDYSVSGNTGTDSNTYTMTITGKGNFTGTATAEWSIAPVKVEELGVSLTKNLVYNGDEQTQPIKVTYLDIVLTEGVDYTLEGNTGTNAGEYTMTITGMGNFTDTYNMQWSIAMDTASVVEVPGAHTWTYEGKAHELVSAGTAIGGTMMYALEENGEYSAEIPTGTNAGEYTIWYYVKGDGVNYADSEKASIEAEIKKAIPTYEIPTDLTATYGDTLADVALPMGFAWDDNTQSVGNAGTNIFTVTFTPADTDNYEIIEGIEVEVEVAKATPEVNIPTASELTYGQTLEESELSVKGWEWVNPDSVPNVINDGYNVIYYIEDADNYDYTGFEGFCYLEGTYPVINLIIPVTVKKTTPEVTPTIPENEYIEGDELPEISVTSKIEGVIAWITELTNGLVAGENILEWQFTPDDADNYEVVTGTAVVEAQTSTTTTTTTTTSTTTSTTTTSTTTTTQPVTTTSTTTTSKVTTTSTTTTSTTTTTQPVTTTSTTTTSTVTTTSTTTTSTSTTTKPVTTTSTTTTSTVTTTSTTTTSTTTTTQPVTTTSTTTTSKVTTTSTTTTSTSTTTKPVTTTSTTTTSKATTTSTTTTSTTTTQPVTTTSTTTTSKVTTTSTTTTSTTTQPVTTSITTTTSKVTTTSTTTTSTTTTTQPVTTTSTTTTSKVTTTSTTTTSTTTTTQPVTTTSTTTTSKVITTSTTTTSTKTTTQPVTTTSTTTTSKVTTTSTTTSTTTTTQPVTTTSTTTTSEDVSTTTITTSSTEITTTTTIETTTLPETTTSTDTTSSEAESTISTAVTSQDTATETTTTAITTLPQTGYSDIYNIIIYGAGILALLGIATIIISKRKED